MAELPVEMYEATPEVGEFVNMVVRRFKAESKGNLTVAMSLAISVCAQTFLNCGGDIDKGNEIGAAVDQGIITTLQAYKDFAKQNVKTSKGRIH